MAAITQIRHAHSDGRAYYDGKIAEGKTHKEALRCLKRRISDAVFARRVDAADEALARQLAERARAEGLSLAGLGGLLGRLTKVVLESALEGEMDAHLGYAKHDPAGNGSGNSRNGKRVKTVLTDVGPVQIEVPRDRDASFEPAIVAKRQRRLGGVDDLVISLVAKGLMGT